MITSDDLDIATIFNSFFNSITSSLEISKWNPSFSPKHLDPVKNAIEKFKDHPSITLIKNRISSECYFNFECFSETEVYHEILKLDGGKKVSGDIPIRAIKGNVRAITPIVTRCFNSSLEVGSFPTELKYADVIPIYKNGSRTDKANYRPISLLPPMSKVFEKLISKQLIKFMENKLSKYLCGFRKGYSTQYALLDLLHSWRGTLYKSGKVGAILMDLSKAFDCMSHELILAKLAAYGLGYHSLKFIHSYLTDRKMRVRIGTEFSEWLCIFFGVPQGSVLGPLLFNIFINDLFFVNLESKICNFADDNTLYACCNSFDNVLKQLMTDLPIVMNWFCNNEMVVNPKKFQIMFLGCNVNNFQIKIGNSIVHSTNKVTLLGVKIDNKLTFDDHIDEICKKANYKINALLRLRKYLEPKHAGMLCDSYVMAVFNYCPLIWMFCTRYARNIINSTLNRARRVVENDKTINVKSKVTSIHTKNLKLMLMEVYKSINKLNPEFMWDMFNSKSVGYNLRCGKVLKLPEFRSQKGQNNFDFRAIMAWNHLPSKIKEAETLSNFKELLINFDTIYCQCKCCQK